MVTSVLFGSVVIVIGIKDSFSAAAVNEAGTNDSFSEVSPPIVGGKITKATAKTKKDQGLILAPHRQVPRLTSGSRLGKLTSAVLARAPHSNLCLSFFPDQDRPPGVPLAISAIIEQVLQVV